MPKSKSQWVVTPIGVICLSLLALITFSMGTLLWRIKYGDGNTQNLNLSAYVDKKTMCANITVSVKPESTKSSVKGFLYTNDDTVENAAAGEIPVSKTEFTLEKGKLFQKKVCAYIRRGLELHLRE